MTRYVLATPIERDIVEAERLVHEFAARNPQTTVTVLRFAQFLSPRQARRSAGCSTCP